MLVEYVEGWLTGRGAKSIDSLAGKPGVLRIRFHAADSTKDLSLKELN